eukprot:TCONS_00021159-protein
MMEITGLCDFFSLLFNGISKCVPATPYQMETSTMRYERLLWDGELWYEWLLLFLANENLDVNEHMKNVKVLFGNVSGSFYKEILTFRNDLQVPEEKEVTNEELRLSSEEGNILMYVAG